MSRISVIVPMYNSFHKIKRNLEMLSKQKNVEVELIIVDDCSTDDSFIDAMKYSSESNFDVKVVQNQQNSGPGVSRNNGIEYATGDYITFVDSDDYLADNFFEVILPLFKKDIDCIVFDYLNVDEKGNKLSEGKSISCCNICSGMINPKEAFVYTAGTTWGKVYKRSLVEKSGARFGEFFRNEDMLFTKHAIAMADTVYYCPEKLYMYIQNPSSLMHDDRLLDEKNCQKSFALLSERLCGKELDEELLSIELREVLNNTVLIKAAKRETRKEIVKYIRTNYKKKHLTTKYFCRYPRYVRVISKLAYHKFVFVLRIITRYKNRLKRKELSVNESK